jgi:hypothetical protein
MARKGEIAEWAKEIRAGLREVEFALRNDRWHDLDLWAAEVAGYAGELQNVAEQLCRDNGHRPSNDS